MGSFTAKRLEEIRSRHNPVDVFVETGVYKGDQTLVAAEIFDNVYGIELNEYYQSISSDRCKQYGHVQIIFGDTIEELPKLINSINENCLFYLDAHYCKLEPPIEKSPFPLWGELKLLKKNRRHDDIIVIDDFHNFGKNREELKFSNDVEWESVTVENVLDFFGDLVIDHHVLDDSLVIWINREKKFPKFHGWPLEKPELKYGIENYPNWSPDFKNLTNLGLTKECKVFVELGTHVGHTAKKVLEYCPEVYYIVIDKWVDTQDEIRLQTKNCFINNCWEYRDRIAILHTDTILGLIQCYNQGIKPNFIFIDADHHTTPCLTEISMSHTMFPKSIVAGHDVQHPLVQEAVNLSTKYYVAESEICGDCFRIKNFKRKI